jgi:hypothetical protein
MSARTETGCRKLTKRGLTSKRMYGPYCIMQQTSIESGYQAPSAAASTQNVNNVLSCTDALATLATARAHDRCDVVPLTSINATINDQLQNTHKLHSSKVPS